MNVKFIRIFTVLLSVVFNFSCDKQQEFNPRPTIKGLTINASNNTLSRTSFDGEKTEWSPNDQLNIIISGGNYSTPHSKIFTITNTAQGTFFNNEVEISPNVEYQFHAIYPSNTAIDVSSKSANINIGAATQTQNGASPTAHIAALDPLYGYCSAVPEAVSIPMKHTAVALKLDVENSTGSTLTLSKLKVTAPTGVAIAGEHTINLETGVLTASAAEGATSRTIELTLNPAISIAANEKHSVWIATAPFTIEQGGSLLFTAIDDNGNEYDVIKSFVDGHTFSSGKIASTTIDLTEVTKSPQDEDVEKEVTLDFSVAANLSPTSNMNDPVNNLLYQSGIYISRIEATSKCYYSSNDGGGLLLVEIKNDNSATLTLPQISGYKISSVTFNNAKTSGINATIELYNREKGKCKIFEPAEVDYNNKKGYTKYITQQEVAINNIVGIIDDTQYYIQFITTDGNHHIKSIDISYKRLR